MTSFPSIREVDQLLFLMGDLGSDDGTLIEWRGDRPLLPSEAYAMLAQHRAEPETSLTSHSACSLRDAATQLFRQADSFAQIAVALLAHDPQRLPSKDFLGSGLKEARRLLELDAELAGTVDPAETETLAQDFIEASRHCRLAAECLDDVRTELHFERLSSRAVALAEETR